VASIPEEWGLKCGIEIHQQLEGRKLFGPYPTTISEDNSYDFEIKRFMRAAAGEGGVIDKAAAQEQQKKKTYLYRGSNISAGLIETDSQPPIPISKLALTAALQTAKFLNSTVSPVIQVMRKTIADGSNTGGFQRTALVARGGHITTCDGKIRIDNINIEEDSCRTLEQTADKKIYHLDRLGIPLVEIGTAPDIKTAIGAKEASKKIGEILRALPNCKRGLGTIRQDVNVSIAAGKRVEIKGAQDLKTIPLLVELEATRQHELIQLRKHLNENNIELEPLNIIDLTKTLNGSPSKILQKALQNKGSILAIKVNGFKNLLGKELVPNYRVGSELSSRAKVIAGVGGIFHSDELPNYGITDDDVNKIKTELKIEENDAFILVAENRSRAQRALTAVQQRLEELYIGIPEEVRKAKQDCTTSYLRPLPGAARMYPETDVPLIRTRSLLPKITLPELIADKTSRFIQDYKLPSDLARHTAKASHSKLFEELANRHKSIKAAFIAETLGPTLTEIKRKYNLDPTSITSKQFKEIFQYLSEDKIHKDIILDVLIDTIKGKFDIKNYESLGTEEIHKIIKQIIDDNPNAPMGALMGQCMKKLAGKASGQVISKELRNLMQNGHK
jgi:glutamyl-tRNA(Gln) amidotransferase subunit E